MSNPEHRRARHRLAALATFGVVVLAGCSSASDGTGSASGDPSSDTGSASGVAPTTVTPAPTATTLTTSAAATTRSSSPRSVARPAPRTRVSAARPAAPSRTGRLPLDLRTGNATQVITVVADSNSDTRATVQRWRKSGGGWRKVGGAVAAYVGSDGIGTASESSSKTPVGSFTMTQAFGRDADPGTRLPYLRTTPDDYWISSPGSSYNTEQRCGNCGYDNGRNERLHDVTPQYDHAVVIDYNTRNAPGGVTQGRGSAFFLHIAAGEPTAGCVAIPRDDLITVMSWLQPADNPRILIGVR